MDSTPTMHRTNHSMVGGMDFRHNRSHTMLSSTTPTMTASSLSASSSSSSSTNISTTATKARALTTTPSSPRSLQPQIPTFVSPWDPQVKTRQKPPIPASSQNSISDSNLNPITSPRNSPPLDFLLDDDPFANLTGGGGTVGMSDIKVPRSPLVKDDHEHDEAPSTTATTTTSRSTSTSPSRNTFSGFGGSGVRSSFPSIASSIISRRPSFPHEAHHHHSSTFSSSSSSTSSQHHVPKTYSHRPSPAHHRPAFKSRPSLPSLDTLAKMNFVPGAGFGARKVRKGKVGAGLPLEPWNDLDSGYTSSGATSPVGGEGIGIGSGGDEAGGDNNVPPVPPLPTSVSRSISATESASSHELSEDSRASITLSSPTHRHSSSSTSPSSSSSSSSSSQVQGHTGSTTTTHLPPNVSLILSSNNPSTCQPIPQGEKPLLPSQLLALGSEVGVVYGYNGGDRSSGGMMMMMAAAAGLVSPSPMSPTLLPASQLPLPLLPPPPPSEPPPRQLMSSWSSSVFEGDGMMPPSRASSGMGIVELDVIHDAESSKSNRRGMDVEVGYDHSLAVRHDDDDGILGADVQDYNDGDGDGDVDDVDDVDRFMDQFMDHYNHQEDDESRLFLEGRQHHHQHHHQQQQEEEEDEDEVLLVRKVDKRLVMDEKIEEMRMPPPRLRSPTLSLSSSPTPPSFVEMAHDDDDAISVSGSRMMSGMTDSASAFPVVVDTRTAILAPTLRTRMTTRTANTYPELEKSSTTTTTTWSSASSSLTTPPPPVLSAKGGSRWSPPPPPPPPPLESVSGTRSRSLSSTYSSSFESESEASSCPRSSLDDDDDGDDDEARIGGRNAHRYNNIQHYQQPPPPRDNSKLLKSPEELTNNTSLLSHAQVSVLGSPPPPLSMPYSGNEDIGYLVSIPNPGCPIPLPPSGYHGGGSVSSNTECEEEISTREDNIATTRRRVPTTTTTMTTMTGYSNFEDRALAEDFNLRRRSRHGVVMIPGRTAGKVVDGSLEFSGVASQEWEEEHNKGKKSASVTKIKMEAEEEEEDVEIGHDVEWEYVVGARSSLMGGGNNGSNVAFGDAQARERQAEGEEEETIAIVTPDAFSEPVNDHDDDDINLVTQRHSLATTTSLNTPTTTTTAFTSSTLDNLMKNELSSSSAIAAALAMSTWKEDTCEGLAAAAARGGNGEMREGIGNDLTYKSDGDACRATTHAAVPLDLNSSPFEWKGYNGRRGRGDDNEEEAGKGEKQRRLAAALERRGNRDQSSYMTSSPGSSSSSGDDDDEDYYGPTGSSPSQLVMNVDSRTQSSRTHSISATPSPGYMSPSTRFPAASGSTRTSGGMFSESDEEEDEEEDDDEDDGRIHNDDDDDDVPLAKSIPSALTAQKSIRHQVRQEREQKKREKALRGRGETARARLMTLRPAAAVPSSSHDAAATVASPSQATTHHQHIDQQKLRRQRIETLKGSISGNPFSAEDLARKLRDVNGLLDSGVEPSSTSAPVGATALYQQQQQARLHSRHHPRRSQSASRSSWDVHPALVTESLPPTPIPPTGSTTSYAQRTKSIKEPSSSYRYHPSSPPSSAHGPSSMTLRPMRSFHRSSTDRRPIGMDDPRSVPLPLDAEQRVSRSSTSVNRSRPSTRDGPQQTSILSPTGISTPHRRSLSQSRSSADRGSPMTISEPVPPIPSARISHDEHRKLVKPHHYESSSSSRAGPTRVSVDTERPSRTTTTTSHQHRPAPVPALPSTSSTVDPSPVPMSASKPDVVVQQRVFVSDMQRFKMVEIGSSTTAGDVIGMIEADGTLMGFAGSGGWMVFEVSQDFGMERPIRSFELVSDVQASWNKDKMVNYLVLRLTPLAIPLNRSAIPSSSPTHSGYVEWEAKRGKWSKRWMQLREHSIWLSKRDNGRDQVQLCSLSNFDAYQVTRSHRAPKPFAFAIKSTDNLSFFENTADYLHSFACSEKDGMVWMEKILVARSYVLFQERHVLFNPKVVNGNASGISRAVTRKATNTIQRPAAPPLLPPFNGTLQSLNYHDVFEPGSLLAKKL